MIFSPNQDIKKELAGTSVSITCYDRYGNVVKRVTSTDDSTIEDPEDEPTDPTVPSGGGQEPTEQVTIVSSVNIFSNNKINANSLASRLVTE